MRRRVADIIMDILVERGIIDCFAVVGGGAMYLDNALALNNKISKYFCHHEQACAIAAEAYARYCGKPACVCVTSGPGATNAITGVMGAWVDSIPMVILSGQVRYEISVQKSGLPLRYRGAQEFDIINSVKNMTKYAVLVTDPYSIKYELNKAIDISISGRRGPVWLDIPQDIQSAIIDDDKLTKYNNNIKVPSVSESDVLQIIDKLNQYKRPVILAGSGISASGNILSFRDFASSLGIPVVGAAVTGDIMDMNNPIYYGSSGSIGPRVGNFIIQNADIILSIGCSLGFDSTGFSQSNFAPNAYILSVDIDEYEMQKPGLNIDCFIKSDLTEFFKKSRKYLHNISIDNKWINYCNYLRQTFSPFEGTNNTIKNEDRVSAYYFWNKIVKYENMISICALGNNTANSVKIQVGIWNPDERLILNKHSGPMGYDLPAAIGAAIASHKTVYCTTGDGSIMMNLQELQTINHYNLPIKIIIFSNDGYNAIRQTSKNFFDGIYIGCTKETGISFPDFSKIAEAFEFKYRCCHNNGELTDTLDWLFNSNERVILEILQKLDDPISPKVMSKLLPDGTYSTPALQDMCPFLSDEDMKKYMVNWDCDI